MRVKSRIVAKTVGRRPMSKTTDEPFNEWNGLPDDEVPPSELMRRLTARMFLATNKPRRQSIRLVTMEAPDR